MWGLANALGYVLVLYNKDRALTLNGPMLDRPQTEKVLVSYTLVFHPSHLLNSTNDWGNSLRNILFPDVLRQRKKIFAGGIKRIKDKEIDRFIHLEFPPLRECWVFYFDFNVGDFTTEENFRASLSKKLSDYEEVYGFHGAENFADRFSDLLKSAHEKTGLQAVVLVDEYDKPLLNAIDDQNLVDAFRKILKTFYGVLKGEDAHILRSVV